MSTKGKIVLLHRPNAEDYAHNLERDFRQLMGLRAEAQGPFDAHLALQATLNWPIALRRALWAEAEVARLQQRIAELEDTLGGQAAQPQAENVVDLDSARNARSGHGRMASQSTGTSG
jgi:hypothetical protein